MTGMKTQYMKLKEINKRVVSERDSLLDKVKTMGSLIKDEKNAQDAVKEKLHKVLLEKKEHRKDNKMKNKIIHDLRLKLGSSKQRHAEQDQLLKDKDKTIALMKDELQSRQSLPRPSVSSPESTESTEGEVAKIKKKKKKTKSKKKKTKIANEEKVTELDDEIDKYMAEVQREYSSTLQTEVESLKSTVEILAKKLRISGELITKLKQHNNYTMNFSRNHLLSI